jgi:hypothetical protein
MAIGLRDRILLWTRAGARCSFEGCRVDLADEAFSFGEMAHIVGQSLDGPRGSDPLPEAERDTDANLMLLCPNHHTQVDSAPIAFDVERLRLMKARHEAWVEACRAVGVAWQPRFADLYYINVPRLSILAAMEGWDPGAVRLPLDQGLSSLGIELAAVLVHYVKIVNSLHLRAVPIAELSRMEAGSHSFVRISGRFRTRNFRAMPGDARTFALKGSLEEDPTIYRTLEGGLRLTIGIDPRWVTTRTAFGIFRPSGGAHDFDGIAALRDLDIPSGHATATPLVLGSLDRSEGD